jgi:hypothetical protein
MITTGRPSVDWMPQTASWLKSARSVFPWWKGASARCALRRKTRVAARVAARTSARPFSSFRAAMVARMVSSGVLGMSITVQGWEE